MCLCKIHFLPKIAWKPIKCYKVVIPCNCNDFYTACKRYKGTFNKPIKHRYLRLGLFQNNLSGEVVHAILKKPPYWRIENGSIIECEIPRFTLYWLGTEGEIGARTIIPLRYI